MFSLISPCSVNLTALLTKFVRIWPRRSGSPSRTSGMPGATCARNSSPFSCAFCAVSLPLRWFEQLARVEVALEHLQLECHHPGGLVQQRALLIRERRERRDLDDRQHAILRRDRDGGEETRWGFTQTGTDANVLGGN